MQCDVTVVGGGMVGAALACGLAQAGFRVALVEAREPDADWPADSHDIRVSALTRASQNLFVNLGAWHAMAAARVTRYHAMHVWDAAGFGEIHFDAADLGEPDLGHIVENRVVQRALWQRLAQSGEVQVFCPDSVTGMEPVADGMRMWLASGGCLQADLIVAADGARSRVRDFAGFELQGWSYDQHALVATVRPAAGHGGVAWQRFLPRGPLALLPLDPGLFSIVWSTAPEHAEELSALDDAAFGAALTEASEGRAGDITAFGPRGVFPLRLQRATSYVKPGVVLVGDAAHVIHPLAGQGVNLGLLDAATLVDVLCDARTAGRALGGLATLRRYERARKGDNLAVQFAMDGFKRLFSNDLPPLRLLRNFGLQAANRYVPLKRLFMRTALGTGGERPSLVQAGR